MQHWQAWSLIPRLIYRWPHSG